MENIIGVKELRLNMDKYAQKVQKGNVFLVMRKNKPLFKIVQADSEEQWERIGDFSKLEKGGIDVQVLLKAL